MRSPAFIFFLMILSLEIVAQSFTVYNYAIPEGLPSSEVYEVYQDKKGFLWFATDNGVVQFDGNRMVTYHTKDGLTDPVVFSFYEDHKGRLWFRTFSGKLCYFENGVIKKYRHNDKLAPYHYRNIFNYIVTENDEVIFTVQELSGRLDSAGTLTVSPVKVAGTFVKSFGGEYLTGTSSHDLPARTIMVDDKQFPVTLAKTSYLNRVIRVVRWRGKLYIALNYEVFEYDGTHLRKMLTNNNPVINLSLDKEDNLWVGYLNGGVERFSNGDFSASWKADFLKTKSVTKVFQDHEGGLWFSTIENGVFHVPNMLIRHFPLPDATRIKGVLAFDDFVLAGDQSGNLFSIDSRTKESQHIKKLDGPLLSLYGNEKNIWMSTPWDIHIYDHQLRLQKKIEEGLANDFSEDYEGNTWVYGGNKLRKFNRNNEEVNVDVIMVPYRSFHIEDSLIFFADRTGLHIRNNKLNVIRIPKEFSDVKISNILTLNDSTLLITTIGKGFMLMDRRSWNVTVFNTENNFIADHIYSSFRTGADLWLGTEKGLVKIPTNRLIERKISFEYLTKKSGLISDKIDFLVESNNALWAFSDNAFSIIPNTFTKFANIKPLFYVQEVKVNDTIISPGKVLDLAYTQNTIEVAFGFISFNNPNVLLRYRLTKDDQWIYTSNKRLRFSSLAPGQYALDLEYSVDNIHWTSAFPTAMTFQVFPPWWNKWYIQFIALGTLCTFSYFYFQHQRSIYRQKHHYLKIINEHQQKLIQSEIVTLERERNRISRELHDRVGTNLTAIKLMVSQLLQQHKEPQAQDIEAQFQIALGEIKEIIYGLTPPSLERYGLFTGLRNYIGKLNRNIPINISIKTFGDDIHTGELNIIVFRVLQELLTNSIKHSFAKNITVHLNAFEDVLNIVYEDDGVGFSYDPFQSGLGLDSIESRIHSVNGTLKFDSGEFGISYTIDIPITLNKEAV